MLFFSIDRRMGVDQWADVGMFMQNIMLLAREHGLHTCPQEAWAIWYKSVAEFLQLPADHMFFCGMALGYMDESAPVNKLRTERAQLAEFATCEASTMPRAFRSVPLLQNLKPSTNPYVRGSSANTFVNRPDDASVTYMPVMLSSSIRL